MNNTTTPAIAGVVLFDKCIKIYYSSVSNFMKKTPQEVLPKKKVSQPGKWIERPRRMEILTCSCGNKYVKSRPNQKVCVRCINEMVAK